MMLPMENQVWKPVPGAPGYYASSLGDICRRIDGRFIEVLSRDYLKHGVLVPYVSVLSSGKAKLKTVCSLVAAAFLGERPQGYKTVHKNGLSWDNAVSNLEYMSDKEFTAKLMTSAASNCVIKYTPSGEFVDIYTSVTEAAKRNYMCRPTMIKYLSGRSRSPIAHDGYVYGYANDDASEKRLALFFSEWKPIDENRKSC